MTNRRTLHALGAGAAALWLGLAAAEARAQGGPNDPPPAPVAAEESSGDPLYGYIATAFLAAGAIFAICKSARR